MMFYPVAASGRVVTMDQGRELALLLGRDVKGPDGKPLRVSRVLNRLAR